MKTLNLAISCICFLAISAVRAAEPTLGWNINIPCQKFVLSNGLTLVVHEDHKAPIVAVNLWYHVGSKNERPGKTGFAHLFEHLMFTGSEHLSAGHNQRAFFQAMESIGATDLNGTTSEDRTDFFENVPKNALDVALWMESDRMGHLLEAVDQAKLDEQRGVVENEMRQDDNQPYGRADELIVKATAPANHPYSWPVMGSMDDLNAASLEDVQNWFKTYYGAANAVLVLAGDVDTTNALALVNKYFGSIPSGPPIARFDSWTARMGAPRREEMSDYVPQPRLYMVWNVPRYGEPDTTRLDLLTDLLSEGKTSRLYKRLIYEEQMATDVNCYVDEREINSQLYICATLRPGQDLNKAEAIVRQELSRLMQKGPTDKELQRVKTQYYASFIRGMERLGGFGGVSDILAMNEAFRGSPDFYKTVLAQVDAATPENIAATGRQWLTEGVFVLHVVPFPSYQTTPDTVDRSKLPTPGPAPEVSFPQLQRATLPNGLKIILAERHDLPLVSFDMIFNAGYASDQIAIPGTDQMAMDMLEEGTDNRSALQISAQLASVGAEMSTSSDLDTSTVHLSAIRPNVAAALDIFADVILHPNFPEDNLKRLQKERIAEIESEKTEPRSMAMRILPKLLYGDDHAYGNSFTGSGTEQSVAQLKRAEMIVFHKKWFVPNNATLVIVGDAQLSRILPRLKDLFGSWSKGAVPKKDIGPVAEPQATAVYLVDRPGSIQSMITVADIAPPTDNTNAIALETMNSILGGAFTSRLNMNLREDKHWSYGVRSRLVPAEGPSPFLVIAPVQTDKTSEAMVEIDKELDGILTNQPVTAEELDTAKKDLTLKLPGQWETDAHVAASIAQMVRFGLPDDYFNTYPDKVRALTQSEVEDSAKLAVHPGHLVWLVVGDLSKIEAPIRALHWGEAQVLNADGNPLGELKIHWQVQRPPSK